MTITKILEQTLSAGATSVTFTDTDIPNSLIRVFSSNPDIIPVSRILINNSLTVSYAPQSSSLDVAVEIVKAGIDIIDNLTTTDAEKALSANQGKLLNDAIGEVSDDISEVSGDLDTLSDNVSTLTETVNNLDIPDNITDLNDINITSIQNGQVLAWDNTSQKFINVNQSGGISIIYSTEEIEVGVWIDNRTLYQKTYVLTSDLSVSNDVFTDTGITLTGIDDIRNGIVYRANNHGLLACDLGVIDGKLKIRNSSLYVVTCASGSTITIQYTKTS